MSNELENTEPLEPPQDTESDKNSLSSWIPSTVGQWLEKLQISKYHTKGGHGFAAEDANTIDDRLRGKSIEVTGTNNAANGADRIASGIAIQTKYCKTAADTVRAAFGKDGNYRYSGQLFEVPKDQYADCAALMKERIASGKVPGFSDPGDAEKLVKQGDITYNQARNIARAGNVDSLVFDAKTQAVTSSYIFAASFAIQYAARVWSGESMKNALSGSVKGAFTASASAFAIGVIAAQLLRTQAATIGNVVVRNGVKSLYQLPVFKYGIESLASFTLGKNVGGMAAVNRVGKLARTNVLTGAVTTAITATPDIYNAAVAKNISWTQFGKNLAVNASGVAGGSAGWAAGAATGAAIGSIVPGVGTVTLGFVGGMIGAIGGGHIATVAAKNLADTIADDDEAIIMREVQDIVAQVAYDFLLSETEIIELGSVIHGSFTSDWCQFVWQAAPKSDDRRELIYSELDAICLAITKKRQSIALPATADVESEIVDIAIHGV